MTVVKGGAKEPLLSDLPSVSIDSSFSGQQILDLATALGSGKLPTAEIENFTGLDAEALVSVRTLSRVLQEYKNHENGTPRMTFGELKDLEAHVAESGILEKIGRSEMPLRAHSIYRSILSAIAAHRKDFPDEIAAEIHRDSRYQTLMSSTLPLYAKNSENGIGMDVIVRYALHSGRPYLSKEIGQVLNVVPSLQEYVRTIAHPNTSDQTADRIEKQLLGVTQIIAAASKDRPDIDTSLLAERLTELQKWPLGNQFVYRCAVICKSCLLPPDDKRSFPQTGQKTPPGFFQFIQSAYDDLSLKHDDDFIRRTTPYDRGTLLEMRENEQPGIVEQKVNECLIGKNTEAAALFSLLSNGYVIHGIGVTEISGKQLRDVTAFKHGSAREIDILASSPSNRDDQLFLFEVKSSGIGVLRSAFGKAPRPNDHTPPEIPHKSQLAALAHLAPSVGREFGYSTAHVVYLIAPPDYTSTSLTPYLAGELRKLSGKFYDTFNPDMRETVHFNTLIVRQNGFLDAYPQPGIDFQLNAK